MAPAATRDAREAVRGQDDRSRHAPPALPLPAGGKGAGAPVAPELPATPAAGGRRGRAGAMPMWCSSCHDGASGDEEDLPIRAKRSKQMKRHKVQHQHQADKTTNTNNHTLNPKPKAISYKP